MAEYLIDVRTNLHPEEIDAQVRQAAAALNSLQMRAVRAGGVTPELRAEAQGLQAKSYATVQASGSTLGQEGEARLRAEFDKLYSTETRAVAQMEQMWKGKDNAFYSNKADLDRNANRYARNATRQAGVSDADVQSAAAEQEAARLTRQRVQEEAIRLEATQRGITFSEESSAAEREAAVTTARRAETEQVRTLAAERALADESGIVETIAQRKVYERELNEQVSARVRQMERENAEQNGTGGSSVYQRLQAYFANRNKPESQQKDASEFATGGQFISQRLFSGGAYAIAGTALYSMVGNVKALVDEGEKTQVMFNQLKAQLADVGQADQFPAIRDHILDMAHAAGESADEVGALASTMLGAFNDPQEAIQATNAGLALMQVSGLQLADVQNNLVALMRTFGITGAQAMNQVDDQVNHLKDTFGVSQKEIVDGVGNIAPLAQDMGLSFKEASTIIAGASAVSGRSATQTANEIGRALTQIEKQLPVITSVLNTPSSQGLLSSIEGDVAKGQTGQVLVELIRHWKELGSAQQNSILTAIGGRREFASLAAALGENQKIIAALDDTSDHSGTTAKRLAEYHASLTYQLKSAGEAFKQMGITLLQSPLGTALADIARAFGDVFRWIGALFGVWQDFDRFLHGVPGQILSIAAAWIILSKLLTSGAVSAAGGVLTDVFKNAGGILTGRKPGGVNAPAETGTAIETSGKAAATEMQAGIETGGAAAASELRAVFTAFIADMNAAAAGLETSAVQEQEAAARQELAALAQGKAAAGQDAASLGQEKAAAGQDAAAAAENVAADTSLTSSIANAGLGATLRASVGPLLEGMGGLLKTLAPVLAYEAANYGEKGGQALFGPGGPFGGKGTFEGIQLKEPVTGGVGFGPFKVGSYPTLTPQERQQVAGKLAQGQYAGVSAQDLEAISKGDKGTGLDLSGYDRNTRQQLTGVARREAGRLAGRKLGDDGNKDYTQSVIDALQKSGVLDDTTAKDLADKINKDDYDAYTEVTKLYNKNKNKQGFQGNIAAARQAAAQAAERAKLINGDGVKTAQDLQKEFESGQINFQTLQDGLNKQLDVYKAMAADAHGEQNLPAAVQQQMDALADQVAKNDLDRADKIAAATDIREKAKASRKGRPDQIAADLAKAQRDADDAQKHDDPQKEAQAYADQQKAEQDAQDYQLALRKSKINIQRARDEANYDPVAAAQDEVDLAQADLDNAKDDAAKQDAEATLDEKKFALQQARQQLAQQTRQNHASLLKAQASAAYNPVAGALADLQAAQGDLDANTDPNQTEALRAKVQDARNSYNQTVVDQARALNSLRQDQDKGNSAQVAADAVQQASADVQRIVAAGGYASSAWADAQRTLLDAQRQAIEAALAQTNAVLNYDEAVANASGDHVRAANDELQKAQAAYNTAVQEYGAGSDQAAAAQIDIINKAADLAHTQVSSGQSTIDFQLQMNQISIQQAIDMEYQLLAVAKNKDDQQAILLKINQLRQEASKDLQFDIPSNININGLLYQSRRLDQLSAAGLGYQDNRNVQVQYNVYAQQDNQAALSDLTNVLAGAPRTGAAPRTL